MKPVLQKSDQNALKIVRFSKIDDLRPIPINFPLEKRLFCPADLTKLQVICTIFGNGGKQRMRIGACDRCGFIGYIDYPSKKWLGDFYSSQWLSSREVDLNREVDRRLRMSKKQIEADWAIRTVKLDKFLKRHILGKNRQIFEIGCGYGQSLAYLAQRGYKVRGCENSKFRAECAKMAYGLSVANVPFEDPNFQHELSAKRFSLIFSHHVLEHVPDPRAMIREASKLQSIGDYIIIGVPDVYTEPTFMTLFYFPHPNAFSRQSLVNLLYSNAYELVHDFSDQEELYLVGRRVSRPIRIGQGEHYLDRSMAKFTTVLGLGRKHFTQFRRVWCYRRLGFDKGGQVVHLEFAERLFGNWYFTIAHKLLMLYLYCRYRHFEAYIDCIVKDVPFRYTKRSQSPIEIQFDGNITLLTK